jgi:predicted unusual protein kinase regulating ubiquinone biosynthesis (AarF/ABC1/UbiB family)
MNDALNKLAHEKLTYYEPMVSLHVHRTARFVRIWYSAAELAYEWQRAEKLAESNVTACSLRHRQVAMRLKQKLVELGPTFLKLGQFVSTRPDIFPMEYVEELKGLQDQVPPFLGKDAIATIEESFKRPINQVFDTFDPTPIASASIGQVHVASKNGVKLAVKVQRPGIRTLFSSDLNILKSIVWLLELMVSNIEGLRCDWNEIFESYVKMMYREIDYKSEALHAIRFKNDYKNYKWMKVPKVYMNLTTSKVLAMEFVPGVKIDNIKAIEALGINRSVLARRLADSYLIQLCRNGFFHCDPHPGNLACDAEEGGRIIYYDFGMMDTLKPSVRSNFVEMILSLYSNDLERAFNALDKLGMINRAKDENAIKKILRIFLDEFSSLVYTTNGVYTSRLSQEEQKEMLKQRRLKLGADLLVKLETEDLFKMPSAFTFVIRSFNCLEGVGRKLDPKYDIFKLVQPFVLEMVQEESGISKFGLTFWPSLAGRLLTSALSFLRPGQSAAARTPRIDDAHGLSSEVYKEVSRLSDQAVMSNQYLRLVSLKQSNIITLAMLAILVNSQALITRGLTSTLSIPGSSLMARFLYSGAVTTVSVRLVTGIVRHALHLHKLSKAMPLS